MVRSRSKTVRTTWSMRSILIMRSGLRGDLLDASRAVPDDLVAGQPIVPVGPDGRLEDGGAMTGRVTRGDDGLLARHAGGEASQPDGLADGVGPGRDPGARILL